MRVAFGHQITSDDDPYVELTEGASHALSNAGSPGSTPAEGMAKPSFLSHLLSAISPEEAEDPEHLLDIQGAAGVPHRSLEDDNYRGMLIPKGSLMIANTK
ncbi:hypothetical protein C0991_000373 [Blastosporella zonata]|nr:hypothetical protein C0991_000373 [Blastosporella zonata]